MRPFYACRGARIPKSAAACMRTSGSQRQRMTMDSYFDGWNEMDVLGALVTSTLDMASKRWTSAKGKQVQVRKRPRPHRRERKEGPNHTSVPRRPAP